MGISPGLLTELYRVMLTIRQFEERVTKAFKAGGMPGFLHACIGMEAVAAGVCVGLRETDKLTSTHRGHGHAIAKGLDLGQLVAELYGKASGVCKGRGGSMHFADASKGMLGGNGIVGGGLPMATGAALAEKLDRSDNIIVAFLGEGGVNQGTFHESLNLAGIWTLPVVYVIENNLYTEYRHYRDLTAIEQLADRAAAYALPGVVVDGQDVVAVHDAMERAVTRARSGDGATLIEAKTTRFHGHHEGEEQILGVNVYRTLDEIEHDKNERDPIVLGRRAALEAGVPERELDAIADAVDRAIDEAMAFAEASPRPDPVDAALSVYSTPIHVEVGNI